MKLAKILFFASILLLMVFMTQAFVQIGSQGINTDQGGINVQGGQVDIGNPDGQIQVQHSRQNTQTVIGTGDTGDDEGAIGGIQLTKTAGQKQVQIGGGIAVEKGPAGKYVNIGGGIDISKNATGKQVQIGGPEGINIEKAGTTKEGSRFGSVRTDEKGNIISAGSLKIGENGIAHAGSVNIDEKGIHGAGFDIKTSEDVKAVFDQEDNVNLNDIKQAAPVIEIKPNQIVVGDTKIQSTGKTLKVITEGGKNVEISSEGNQVLIKEGGMEVITNGVTVENDKIKVNNVEIKAPGEAINAEIKGKSTQIEINSEGGKPVYTVQTKEDKKFLGLFSVTMNGNIKIDATDGKTIKVETPWWSFLTT